MSAFSFVRLLLLGLVWAVSIVVLGIAANSIALSIAVVWSYPIVALVVAVLTHIISTPMVIISIAKPGAVTSRVIVEISWVSFLWLLWLCVGIMTSSISIFPAGCSSYRSFYGDDAASQCLQFLVLRGCAWANTVALFLYAAHLFVLCIVTNNRNRGTLNSTNAFFSDASLLRFSILVNQQRSSFVPSTSSTSRGDIEKKPSIPTPTYPSKIYYDTRSLNRYSSAPTLKPYSSNPHAFWVEAQRVSSLSSLTLPNPDDLAASKLTTRSPTGSATYTSPRRQHSNRSTRTSRSSSSQGSSRGSVYRTYAPSPLSQMQPVILTLERRYPN